MPAPRSSGPLRPGGRGAATTRGRNDARRSAKAVAPERPLALLAAWAGVASALVGCVVAIGVVAVLWLPASGGSGSAGSAIRAGVLTFLAGVHGGITVAAVPTAFVPLGLTILVAVIIWRAGTAVAATAEERGEGRPLILIRALGVQCVVFALTCALLAAGSSLGTSSASIIGAFLAGAVLNGLVAGAAMLRHTRLGADLRWFAPSWAPPALKCATAAVAVYVGAGALLTAGSLLLHHDRVMTLSQQVGGGWSSVPVLVLGVLAAPNAAIAAAGLLSGAGFAVGSGTTVGLTGATTGLVPAFPILGAVPASGGSVIVWMLAVITPLAAGASIAAIAGRVDTVIGRWRVAGAATAFTGVFGAVLAWQGGGGIGSGHLHAVGASPWQFALLLALWTGVASAALLGARSGVEALRNAEHPDRPSLRDTFAALTAVEQYDENDDENGTGDDRPENAETDASDTTPFRRPGKRGNLAG